MWGSVQFGASGREVRTGQVIRGRGSVMWGEGASDLWGYLEWEEEEREMGLLDAVTARLDGHEAREVEDENAAVSPEVT
jgi:hypothetical protein